MRPGFYTRKSAVNMETLTKTALSFNEAGILHPEKPQEIR